MRIPAAVLAEVDYRAAVIGELNARNRYLPPPLADRALLGHVEDLIGRVQARMRRDFHPAQQDSVTTRDSSTRLSLRPATTWPSPRLWSCCRVVLAASLGCLR